MSTKKRKKKAPKMVEVICQVCKGIFEVSIKAAHNAKYCPDCRREAYYELDKKSKKEGRSRQNGPIDKKDDRSWRLISEPLPFYECLTPGMPLSTIDVKEMIKRGSLIVGSRIEATSPASIDGILYKVGQYELKVKGLELVE